MRAQRRAEATDDGGAICAGAFSGTSDGERPWSSATPASSAGNACSRLSGDLGVNGDLGVRGDLGVLGDFGAPAGDFGDLAVKTPAVKSPRSVFPTGSSPQDIGDDTPG